MPHPTDSNSEPPAKWPMIDPIRIELLAARLFERDFQETGIPRPFNEISSTAQQRYRRHAIELLNFIFEKLDVRRLE